MVFPRLKEMRLKRQMTQVEVGRHLYVDQQTYSLYERGKRTLSPESLIRLSTLFHVSIDYLLGLTDELMPYPPCKKR